MLSWRTWKANVRVTDVWFPFVTIDVVIFVLEWSPLVLGNTWGEFVTGEIPLVNGGVWL